jgi:hypothetical protein
MIQISTLRFLVALRAAACQHFYSKLGSMNSSCADIRYESVLSITQRPGDQT